MLSSLLLAGCAGSSAGEDDADSTISTEVEVEGKAQIAPPEGFELIDGDGVRVLRRDAESTSTTEAPAVDDPDAVVLGEAVTVDRMTDGLVVTAGSIPEAATITIPCTDDGAIEVTEVGYRDTGAGLQVVAAVAVADGEACSPVDLEVPLAEPLSLARAVAADASFLDLVDRAG